VAFRWQKICLVVLAVLLVGVSVAIVTQQTKPPPQIPYKHPPMISIDSSPNSPNTTRGATLNVTLTVTSALDVALSLPLENVTLSGYNNTSWKAQMPQEQVFTFWFSENPLVLPPNGTRSCVLTLTFAADAPVGDYVLYVYYGNRSLTHVGASTLFMAVKS
jgi:hypothetical protein